MRAILRRSLYSLVLLRLSRKFLGQIAAPRKSFRCNTYKHSTTPPISTAPPPHNSFRISIYSRPAHPQFATTYSNAKPFIRNTYKNPGGGVRLLLTNRSRHRATQAPLNPIVSVHPCDVAPI